MCQASASIRPLEQLFAVRPTGSATATVEAVHAYATLEGKAAWAQLFQFARRYRTGGVTESADLVALRANGEELSVDALFDL